MQRFTVSDAQGGTIQTVMHMIRGQVVVFCTHFDRDGIMRNANVGLPRLSMFDLVEDVTAQVRRLMPQP